MQRRGFLKLLAAAPVAAAVDPTAALEALAAKPKPPAGAIPLAAAVQSTEEILKPMMRQALMEPSQILMNRSTFDHLKSVSSPSYVPEMLGWRVPVAVDPTAPEDRITMISLT